MINLSGLYWATDVLNGQKPIPQRPKNKNADMGEFKDVFDKALETRKELEDEKKVIGGNPHT